MSDPKVVLTNNLYEITLVRRGRAVTHFFLQEDFRVMRTDDVDADDFNVDDEGYSYYIFARENFQSQHLSLVIQPDEADSILDQIFELTGKYACDY